MNKLSIFLACAAMVGFASCETDTEPRLTIPADHSFVLNEPVFGDQELVLENGGTFELTASQPDYGYAAAATYSMEVAITPDFTEVEILKPNDPGSARMVFSDHALATALCNLYGFDAANYEDLPAAPVYFRASCEIPGIENSRCVSNIVSYKLVKFYHAVQGKRNIYLVGNVSGWTTPDEGSAAHYANWSLVESEIGSNVYLGSFTFPAGEAEFRFYNELSGWGDNGQAPSIGANPNDGDALSIELKDGVYSGPCVWGKGSWKMMVETEGNVNITVDLNDMKVIFEVGGEANWDVYPKIYLIGQPQGWNIDSDEVTLYDTTGAGIYVNKTGVPVKFDNGDNYFRFYETLGDWGGDGALPSMGALPNDDTNIHCDFEDGIFNGTWVPGKGSWVITSDGTTYYDMEVNVKTGTVKFTQVDAPAE